MGTLLGILVLIIVGYLLLKFVTLFLALPLWVVLLIIIVLLLAR